MTKHERQAQAAGKALAKALLRIEGYDDDPSHVIEEARIFLSSAGSGKEGAGLALDWLEGGYGGTLGDYCQEH